MASLPIPRRYRKYEKSVTVSVVSYRPIRGDRAVNLARMMQTVTFAAAHRGARIIVFPELALVGYGCEGGAPGRDRPCSMHRMTAETVPGPSTQSMAGLAGQLGVYIVFGMPEIDRADKSIYNAVAVVGPEGVLGSYRARHLLEGKPCFTGKLCFRSGSALPVFDTRYGPIGVQTGGDFWCFPELTRSLVLGGARIVLNCTAVPDGPGMIELITWGTACRGAESAVYTASANLVGADRDRLFCGRSVIAGPAPPAPVSIYAQGDEFEGIVTATLDLERLDGYRKRFGPKRRSKRGSAIKE